MSIYSNEGLRGELGWGNQSGLPSNYETIVGNANFEEGKSIGAIFSTSGLRFLLSPNVDQERKITLNDNVISGPIYVQPDSILSSTRKDLILVGGGYLETTQPKVQQQPTGPKIDVIFLGRGVIKGDIIFRRCIQGKVVFGDVVKHEGNVIQE